MAAWFCRSVGNARRLAIGRRRSERARARGLRHLIQGLTERGAFSFEAAPLRLLRHQPGDLAACLHLRIDDALPLDGTDGVCPRRPQAATKPSPVADGETSPCRAPRHAGRFDAGR